MTATTLAAGFGSACSSDDEPTPTTEPGRITSIDGPAQVDDGAVTPGSLDGE